MVPKDHSGAREHCPGNAHAGILQAGRWKSSAMVNRYGERLLARNGAAAQLARIQGRGA